MSGGSVLALVVVIGCTALGAVGGFFAGRVRPDDKPTPSAVDGPVDGIDDVSNSAATPRMPALAGPMEEGPMRERPKMPAPPDRRVVLAELSDTEIDALPAELPPAAARRQHRPMRPPRTFDRL